MGKESNNSNSLITSYLQLIRWNAPIGTWLLFWPCSWGIALAASQSFISSMEALNLAALFFIGAFAMRSAGCIINDMWDRKIDAQVERTRNRPLASGALSMLQALILLAISLFVSLLITTQLKWEVFWLAVLSLPLIIAYPLMKRITWWPQAFLGLTFNFGALMGWVAVSGDLSWPALLLYLSGIYWTLGYDTIYAFQDISDDEKIGVKSTARRLQKVAKPMLFLFYLISVISFFAALFTADASLLSLCLCIIPATMLCWQISQFSLSNSTNYRALFCQNAWVGAGFLVPIIANLL